MYPQNKWSQCEHCKLVITTVNLWRHVRTQHTKQPPRRCEYCNKNFKNKYSLREHVRMAHEQKLTTTLVSPDDDDDDNSLTHLNTPNTPQSTSPTTDIVM